MTCGGARETREAAVLQMPQTVGDPQMHHPVKSELVTPPGIHASFLPHLHVSLNRIFSFFPWNAWERCERKNKTVKYFVPSLSGVIWSDVRCWWRWHSRISSQSGFHTASALWCCSLCVFTNNVMYRPDKNNEGACHHRSCCSSFIDVLPHDKINTKKKRICLCMSSLKSIHTCTTNIFSSHVQLNPQLYF